MNEIRKDLVGGSRPSLLLVSRKKNEVKQVLSQFLVIEDEGILAHFHP